MKFTGREWTVVWIIALASVSPAQNRVRVNPPPATSVQTPDQISQPDPKSQAAALSSLKALVTDQNFAKMGFRTREESAAATFGIPIHRYIIRPDKLLSFDDRTEPASILEDTGHWVYPVEVDRAVRCGVILASQKGGAWTPISFGEQGFSRVLFDTRRQAAAALNPPSEAPYFLVDVLSSQRKFIVRRNDGKAPTAQPGAGKILFTWIGNPPPGNDKTQLAETVLRYLAKLARNPMVRAPGH